jgi:hypothetical protein
MLEGVAMFGDLCLKAGDYHLAKKRLQAWAG